MRWFCVLHLQPSASVHFSEAQRDKLCKVPMRRTYRHAPLRAYPEVQAELCIHALRVRSSAGQGNAAPRGARAVFFYGTAVTARLLGPILLREGNVSSVQLQSRRRLREACPLPRPDGSVLSPFAVTVCCLLLPRRFFGSRYVCSALWLPLCLSHENKERAAVQQGVPWPLKKAAVLHRRTEGLRINLWGSCC